MACMLILMAGNLYLYFSARSKVRRCRICGYTGLLKHAVDTRENRLKLVYYTIAGIIPGMILFSLLCREYRCPECGLTIYSSKSYWYPFL